MELKKILAPNVGKCFKERSINGNQKFIVIGNDSRGFVDCIFLRSYSYDYISMRKFYDKTCIPIKRVKGVSVKKKKDLLEEDDVFISRLGTNIKFKNNLCLTFSNYSSTCLKYYETTDDYNFVVLHGGQKKTVIKHIIHELRSEINNSVSLKEKYRKLKEKDEDEIIRLYRERIFNRNNEPYGLCLLEKKLKEKGNIIIRLIKKFIC